MAWRVCRASGWGHRTGAPGHGHGGSNGRSSSSSVNCRLSGPQRSIAHLPARLGGSPASLLLLSECEREGREQQEPLLLVLLPFFFSSDGTPYRNDRCQLLIPAARFSLDDDDGEYSFACLLVLAPFRAPAVDVLCPSVRRAAPDRRFIYHTQGAPCYLPRLRDQRTVAVDCRTRLPERRQSSQSSLDQKTYWPCRACHVSQHVYRVSRPAGHVPCPARRAYTWMGDMARPGRNVYSGSYGDGNNR